MKVAALRNNIVQLRKAASAAQPDVVALDKKRRQQAQAAAESAAAAALAAEEARRAEAERLASEKKAKAIEQERIRAASEARRLGKASPVRSDHRTGDDDNGGDDGDANHGRGSPRVRSRSPTERNPNRPQLPSSAQIQAAAAAAEATLLPERMVEALIGSKDITELSAEQRWALVRKRFKRRWRPPSALGPI